MGLLSLLGGIGGIASKMIGPAVSIGSRLFSREDEQSNLRKDRRLQQQFAKHGIQWRVDDAKKAGIHPLYATGAPAISYQPQNIGGGHLRGMGQDVTRAINATRTTPEKQLLSESVKRAQAETGNIILRNQILKKELEGINSPGMMTTTKPIAGINGQNSTLYKQNEIPISDKIGRTGGMGPLESDYIDARGRVLHLPAKDPQEPLSEGSLFTQFKYNLMQLKDYIDGYRSTLRPGPKHQEFLKYLYRIRRKSNDPDKEFRYNVIFGGFKLKRKGKEGTQLFDHPRLWRHKRIKLKRAHRRNR